MNINFFEYFFLSFGFSWFASKFIPYFLFLLIGFIVWFILRKRFKVRWKKFAGLFIFILLFFLPYLIVNPIYQVDFANSAASIPKPTELSEEESGTLLIYVLPDCPYCYQSIELSNMLLKRNKNCKIAYRLFGKELEAIDHYKKYADPDIDFRLTTDAEFVSSLTNGSFPCFVLINGNNIEKWSNSEMSPAVLDYIESVQE